jgi:hypothetical protein
MVQVVHNSACHIIRFSWPLDLLRGQPVNRPMRDASTREKTCTNMWAYLLARLMSARLCFESLREASVDVITINFLSPSQTFRSPLHVPRESRPLSLSLPRCGEVCSPPPHTCHPPHLLCSNGVAGSPLLLLLLCPRGHASSKSERERERSRCCPTGRSVFRNLYLHYLERAAALPSPPPL